MSEFRLYELAGPDGYPAEWHDSIKDQVRELAGYRCVRCGHPYRNGEHGNGEWSPCDDRCSHEGDGQWRILTVHHLDGNKQRRIVNWLCRDCPRFRKLQELLDGAKVASHYRSPEEQARIRATSRVILERRLTDGWEQGDRVTAREKAIEAGLKAAEKDPRWRFEIYPTGWVEDIVTIAAPHIESALLDRIERKVRLQGLVDPDSTDAWSNGWEAALDAVLAILTEIRQEG